MFKIMYYYSTSASTKISKILANIQATNYISYEMIDLSTNGEYDREKEKRVYETDFKPKAKILKYRTGHPITVLRSRKARNYFVSTPGTVAISSPEGVEWYAIDEKKIFEFLRDVELRGQHVIDDRCK